MKRRFLSGLLAVCLVLSLGMTCAFSDGTEEPVPEEAGQTAEYPPVADGGGQADLPALSQAAPETGDGQAPAEPVPEEVTAPQAETVPQEEAAPLDETVAQDEAAPLDAEEEEAEDPGIMLASTGVPMPAALMATPTLTAEPSTLTLGDGQTEITLTITDEGITFDYGVNMEQESFSLSGDASSDLHVASVDSVSEPANKSIKVILSGPPTVAGDLTIKVPATAFEPDADSDATVTITVNKAKTATPQFGDGGTVTATNGNKKATLTLSNSYDSGISEVKVYQGESPVGDPEAAYDDDTITLTFKNALTKEQTYQISLTEDGKLESERSADVTVTPQTISLTALTVGGQRIEVADQPAGLDQENPKKLTANLTTYVPNFTITAEFDAPTIPTVKYSTTSFSDAKDSGTELKNSESSYPIPIDSGDTKTVYIYVKDSKGIEGYYELTVTNQTQPKTDTPTFEKADVIATGDNKTATFTVQNKEKYTQPVAVAVTPNENIQKSTYDLAGGTITLTFKNALTAKTTYQLKLTEQGKAESEQAQVTVQPRTPDPTSVKTTVTALAGNKTAEVTLSNAGDYNLYDPKVEVTGGTPTVSSASYNTGTITLTFSGPITTSQTYSISMTNQTGDWAKSTGTLTVTVDPGPTLNSLTVDSQSVTLSGKDPTNDQSNPTTLDTVTLDTRKDSFTLTADFDGTARYSTTSAKDAKDNGTSLRKNSPSGAISFPSGALSEELSQDVYIYVNKNGADIYYKLKVTNPAGPKLNSLKVDSTPASVPGTPSTDPSAPTTIKVHLQAHEDSFTVTAEFEGTAKYSTESAEAAESGTPLTSGNPVTIQDAGGEDEIFVYICITKNGKDIYYKLDIDDPVAPKLNSLTVNGKAVDGDLTQHGTVGAPTKLTVELGPLDETFTLTAGFEAEWARFSLTSAQAAATGTDLTSGSPSPAILITKAQTTVWLCLCNNEMNIYYELTVTRPDVEVDVPSEPSAGTPGVADKDQTEQQLLTVTDDIVSAVQAGSTPTGIDNAAIEAIKQAIQAGDTITTELSVKPSNGGNAATQFQARLADGETIDQYLDINILVKVNNSTKGNITETADDLQFAVVLSDDVLAKGVGFYVLRQHDGAIEKLPAKVSGNTLTFSSDKFSQFGVVYTSSVADAVVDAIPDQTYTGSAITPAPHVTTQAGVELKAGEDYTVTYKNNVQAGTATAVITGTGGFTGTLEVTFRILQPAAGGTDKTVPNTGDGSPLLLWLTLLSVQAAALALIPFARKRKAACRTASGAGDRHGRK